MHMKFGHAIPVGLRAGQTLTYPVISLNLDQACQHNMSLIRYLQKWTVNSKEQYNVVRDYKNSRWVLHMMGFIEQSTEVWFNTESFLGFLYQGSATPGGDGCESFQTFQPSTQASSSVNSSNIQFVHINQSELKMEYNPISSTCYSPNTIPAQSCT